MLVDLCIRKGPSSSARSIPNGRTTRPCDQKEFQENTEHCNSITEQRHTSIEPKEKRFLLGGVGGLEEPAEERPTVALVDGHVAGVVAEVDMGWPGSRTTRSACCCFDAL